MITSPISNIKVVFGAMTIGKPGQPAPMDRCNSLILTKLPLGVEMTRVFSLEDTAAILDTFQKHGHKEIDTARVYGEGSSEEYLGDIHWQDRGLVVDTKLYPTALRPA